MQFSHMSISSSGGSISYVHIYCASHTQVGEARYTSNIGDHLSLIRPLLF